jgi:thiamine kinase-like enzyme
MIYEFDYLKKVPKGIGPKPVYIDKSRKIIPKIYIVLEYIEGKHVLKWSKKHLAAHAKRLAELHKDRKPYHTYQTYNFHREKQKTFDLYKTIKNEIKGYKKLFGEKDVKDIMPKVLEYIKENNHYFTSLKRFSLIHQDPNPTNTLFYKNEIYYIDWEWACYGDPARDVGLLYCDEFTVKPWIIKLDAKRRDYYLNQYLKHHPDKTLKKRVELWQVFNLFVTFLFCKRKLEYFKIEPKISSRSYYAEALEKCEKALRKKFL